MNRFIYTAEHIQFLRDNAKGKSNAELTALFNARFGTKKSINNIVYCKNENAIRSGICSKFKPNHAAWAKGNRSLPIGTEKEIGERRYIIVKVSYHRQPRYKNWAYKHKLIWEAANGKLPKGYGIFFADQNTRNLNLDNLIAVPRAVIALINKHSLLTTDPELNKTALAVIKLELLIAKQRLKVNKKEKRKEANDE